MFRFRISRPSVANSSPGSNSDTNDTMTEITAKSSIKVKPLTLHTPTPRFLPYKWDEDAALNDTIGATILAAILSHSSYIPLTQVQLTS